MPDNTPDSQNKKDRMILSSSELMEKNELKDVLKQMTLLTQSMYQNEIPACLSDPYQKYKEHETFDRFVFPVILEWNKILSDYFGTEIDRKAPYYLMSFARMSEPELAFVSGLFGERVYHKTFALAERQAFESLKEQYAREKTHQFLPSVIQQSFPSVETLFPQMMEQDVILPIKKEYLPWFQKMREAGDLLRLYYNPEFKQDRCNMGLDLPVEKWESEYQILRGMLRVSNGLDKRLLKIYAPDFSRVMDSVVRQFAHGGLDMLERLPSNTIDELMPMRRKALLPFLRKIIGNRVPMTITCKYDCYTYLGTALNKALLMNAEFNKDWNVANALWFRQSSAPYFTKLTRQLTERKNGFLPIDKNRQRDE